MTSSVQPESPLFFSNSPYYLPNEPVSLPPLPFQTQLLKMVFKLQVLTASLAVSPNTTASASFDHPSLILPKNFGEATTITSTLLPVTSKILNVTAQSEAPGVESSLALEDVSRTIAIITIGLLFAILTSVGNLMVMVSFKIDKQLQTISNYFLFSLAVADIAIGVISIPLMTYYIVVGHWGIGYTVCQFWLCIDYLMSNASVLNLLLISFDRYFSITRPLSYRPRRTTKKALTMIACTYIISLILWPPWIISWPYIEGKFTTDPGKCVVQFLETNPYVTVGTAIAAFYLPVTIMIVLYSRVYAETEKRRKEFAKLQGGQNRSIRKPEIPSAPSSNSLSNKHSLISKRKWSQLMGRRSSLSRCRWSWVRACTARSVNSSEDSSDVPVCADDTSLTSSFKRRGCPNSRPHSPPQRLEDTILADSPTTEEARNGSSRQRPKHRQSVTAGSNCIVKKDDQPPSIQVPSNIPEPGGNEMYTVLIELNDDGARPTVRLSNCEAAWNQTIESPTSGRNTRNRSKSEAVSINEDVRKLANESSAATNVATGGGLGGLLRNGRAKLSAMNGGERKSEKERKRNERKQDSKAAKTLSAILFAFIVTWTPYNVIVCWEAFFPNTFSETLFTISYCLCYINSTINPLCYALCNARFRHTYKRILRCQFKAERPSMHQQGLLRSRGA